MGEFVKPRVSDRVLYVSRGSADGVYPPQCRAAIVTEAGAWVTTSDSSRWMPGDRPVKPQPGDRRTLEQEWQDDAAVLAVFNPGGFFLNPDQPVPYHSGCDTDGAFVGWQGGTWHWPGDEPGATQ